MATMGKYCKAYPIKRLREFSAWTEKAENARSIGENESGEKSSEPRRLTDEDYLFVQEDFRVTDGIFVDENIIFDDVSPEWIEYCRNTLGFEMPAYLLAQEENSEGVPIASTSSVG
jgi:hypothetical protein